VEPARVELRVVLGETWSEANRRVLDREVRNVLGPSAHMDLVRVDHIPLTAAGKHQVVVSLCDAAGTSRSAAERTDMAASAP
jgi:hypothetical protein